MPKYAARLFTCSTWEQPEPIEGRRERWQAPRAQGDEPGRRQEFRGLDSLAAAVASGKWHCRVPPSLPLVAHDIIESRLRCRPRRRARRVSVSRAQHVWATMKGNDSHECRNCRSWEAMSPDNRHPGDQSLPPPLLRGAWPRRHSDDSRAFQALCSGGVSQSWEHRDLLCGPPARASGRTKADTSSSTHMNAKHRPIIPPARITTHANG